MRNAFIPTFPFIIPQIRRFVKEGLRRMQKKMHVPENFLRGIQCAGLFNRRKWDVKNQCSRRVRVILADADNRKFSIKQGIRLQKRHAYSVTPMNTTGSVSIPETSDTTVSYRLSISAKTASLCRSSAVETVMPSETAAVRSRSGSVSRSRRSAFVTAYRITNLIVCPPLKAPSFFRG